MVTSSTACPCCEKEVLFSVDGWFILKEPLPELIASLEGDPASTRPADLPLLGLCTTDCPRCGEKCLIDFRMQLDSYLDLLSRHFPDEFGRRVEIEDNRFFEALGGDLTQFALSDSIDVTCLT